MACRCRVLNRPRAISVVCVTAGVTALASIQLAIWNVLQPILHLQSQSAHQMSTAVRLAIVGIATLTAFWVWDCWDTRRVPTTLAKGLCVAVLFLPSLWLFVPLEVTVLFLEPVLLCCCVGVIAQRFGLSRISAVVGSLALVPICAFVATIVSTLWIGATETVQVFSAVAGGGALLGFGAAVLQVEKLFTEIR